MSQKPKQSPRPRRNPSLAFRSVGHDGGLVVDPSESQIRVLNPVGSKIYSMLDGEHTDDEIVRAVMEEFDVSEADARRDLDEFLKELDAKAMLAGERPQATSVEEAKDE